MLKTKAQDFDRNLLKVSRLFYEDGLSKTEVADLLKISITHVNRLLKEAEKRGIVRIVIEAPRFTNLELDLIKNFGLKEARVVPFTEDEYFLRIDIGAEGARYFENKVKEGSKIGMGSGRTLYEMTVAMREQPKQVTIYPIAIIAENEPEIRGISAATVTNILWFKLRPAAKAYKIDLFFHHKSFTKIKKEVGTLRKEEVVNKIWNQVLNLDFYFYSVSHLRQDSQIVEILKGINKTIKDLTKLRIVGDIVFNTINEVGEHVPCGIEDLTITLSTKQLQQLATNTNKNIVLIAGGEKKIQVVQAALRAKLCNTLITDDKTAAQVLAEQERYEEAPGLSARR